MEAVEIHKIRMQVAVELAEETGNKVSSAEKAIEQARGAEAAYKHAASLATGLMERAKKEVGDSTEEEIALLTEVNKWLLRVVGSNENMVGKIQRDCLTKGGELYAYQKQKDQFLKMAVGAEQRIEALLAEPVEGKRVPGKHPGKGLKAKRSRKKDADT